MALPNISHLPPSFIVAVSLVTSLISIVGQLRPWPPTLPQGLLTLDIAGEVLLDPDATAGFSTDFGCLARAAPAAVLRPSAPDDIAALVRFSYSSPQPFAIAARGHGHSIRGQALAPGGVVVDMASLGHGRADRISVSFDNAPLVWYVDAGGEQLWIDVLHETLKHGLAPRSWTDYLYLTVGGTLSNAGVSGQAFRHGPQISNVYELDVITGKGEMITCSHENKSDLFYGVLGGLGQFGIITRARIALEPAPQRVRWVRLIYTHFVSFSRDQELLISMMDQGFDYVEGSLLMDHTLITNWRSSFFSKTNSEKIRELAAEFGAIYCLEGAVYYHELAMASRVDQKLHLLLQRLSFVPGFAFTNDVSYVGFLDRVHDGEVKLRSMGLWEVPHPWLNIFVPKSRIQDFEVGVFKGILMPNNSTGPVLIYPMIKNKWHDEMSAVTPDEEVFYSIGLLRSAITDDWQDLDNQNDDILGFCHREGIQFKQYMPHYASQRDWKNHFGRKWDTFVEMKRRYDPKALLSPGQRIFTSSLTDHV
ncbi:unnamed protein product [Musa acuminata var. zebrina]